jgi:ubiquinone/menaquinone biosynthesis C-methylase UbiE
MLWTRYAWAAGHAAGKNVAEIGCGAGCGLGWLARMARTVEAGDPDDANCYLAQETYAGRPKIRIRRIYSSNLPFADASLDLLLRLEDIDNLPSAQAFLAESRRVLRRNGTLLIASRTLGSTAAEVIETLAQAGFTAHLKAGFPRRGVFGWLQSKRGPLEPVPRELEPGLHSTSPLITIAPGMNLTRYRTLYIEARRIP